MFASLSQSHLVTGPVDTMICSVLDLTCLTIICKTNDAFSYSFASDEKRGFGKMRADAQIQQ